MMRAVEVLPCEKVGVRHLALLDLAGQRQRDVILPDDLGETLRPVLAV